ncbi:MAG TPA: hypothetical protein VFU15_11595 [Bacteroidia bacterium]|nr:hypothetical protein [Bacteroidia bacterium]
MKKYFPVMILLILSLCGGKEIAAQNELADIMKSDSLTLPAISIYPDSIRTAMCIAGEYPEVLVKMENLQGASQSAFHAILAPYSQEEQQKIWDLSRYPDLLQRIGSGKENAEKIAADYPAEIHDRIIYVAANRKDVAQKIVKLQQSADSSFNGIIASYPAEAQDAFRKLLLYPETVKLLTDNMRTTVMIGDLYRRNPKQLGHQLDSIQMIEAQQRTQEAKDWQDGLAKDTAAQREMKEAVNEYAQQNPTGSTDLTSPTTTQVIIVQQYVYPYPYWYGYPVWYDYPCWYPTPWWYDCGYYCGPQGCVWIGYGYPSPFFFHWYFWYYPHHYHYHHFSDYCVHHYEHHRRSTSPSDGEIGGWMQAQHPYVSPDFFVDDGKRADRLKSLGKEEMDRQQYNVAHPAQQVSRDAYIRQHSGNYPGVQVAPPPVPAKPGDANSGQKPYTPPPAKPQRNPVPTNPNQNTRPTYPNQPRPQQNPPPRNNPPAPKPNPPQKSPPPSPKKPR